MKNLKARLFLLIIISCTVSCTNRLENLPERVIPAVLVPKSIKEDFLNNFQKAIDDSKLNTCKLITFTKYSYPFLDKYHIQIAHIYKPFTFSDDQFISDQINSYENEERNNKDINVSLKTLLLISESKIKSMGKTYKTFWDGFHKQYGHVPFIECSKPLFSKKFDYAVMQIGINSKPASSFVREVYVFKRVNLKWTYFKKL